MEELALSILDIAENSVNADANNVAVLIEESARKNLLLVSVKDDGRGMDKELVEQVLDPFVTSRTTRDVGMGLPLLRQIAEDCNGLFHLESTPGTGTFVEAIFQLNHIDRPPLGDLLTTFMTLIIGFPKVAFDLCARSDSHTFHFDTTTLASALENNRIDSPEGLRRLRKHIKRGIEETAFSDHVGLLAETGRQPAEAG